MLTENRTDSTYALKSYMVSAVEKEIDAGFVLSRKLSERVRVFQRVFKPDSLDQDSPVFSMYLDTRAGMVDQEAQKLLRKLQDDVIPQVVTAERITKYPIEFRGGVDPTYEQHRAYLVNLMDDVTKAILDSLDAVEAARAVEPSSLIDEVRQQLSFAKQRAERFSPTGSSSTALQRVNQWVRGSGGRTFVVFGASGAGKTYVMAKKVIDLSLEGITCVVRFLGTSGDSADVSSVLRSICEQLRIISMGRDPFISGNSSVGLGPCPLIHEELVKYFKEAIDSWSCGRLVLALDSLDQLNDTNSGRMLDWLPVNSFSDKVHIVCSTLPDELNPEVGRPYRCLSILRKRIQSEEYFSEVAQLKDSGLLIEHLLKLKNRTATKIQLDTAVKILKCGDGKAQTALMATLVADMVSQWRSSTQLPASSPSSVRGIIVHYLDSMEDIFEKAGKEKRKIFVKHCLAYITCPKNGISSTELQEVLSLDDDVLADSHQWWFTPDRRVPSAPLLLLLNSLASYLSQKGLLRFWYHRQLWEAAEAHILSDPIFRADRYRVLAEFFSGRFAGKRKPCNGNLRIRLGLTEANAAAGVDRHVRHQPAAFKGASAFDASSVINDRRCAEAMHHMVKELQILDRLQTRDGSDVRQRIQECSKMAEAELCSAEMVCARSLTGEMFNLVWQSAKFLQLVSGENIDLAKADHFNRWIRRDAHEMIVSAGCVAASALRQPTMSKAREEYLISRSRMFGMPWMVLGGQVDFDAVVAVLKGHESAVKCVDWFESKIVSGDGHGKIVVWNAFTGEKLSEFQGHADEVLSVRWSPKGDQIASGSYDKTIIIWDATTGDKVSELKGHTGEVMSVAWSPNRSQIVSGSSDKTSLIWNVASGQKVAQLQGHTDYVRSVAWSPGGEQIATASDDKSVLVWDAESGQQVNKKMRLELSFTITNNLPMTPMLCRCLGWRGTWAMSRVSPGALLVRS